MTDGFTQQRNSRETDRHNPEQATQTADTVDEDDIDSSEVVRTADAIESVWNGGLVD